MRPPAVPTDDNGLGDRERADPGAEAEQALLGEWAALTGGTNERE
ncbi:MAG: hypothetical protein AB1Z98_32465 [Nannocystaceae bacterium]